jgi:hypothetical protein
MFKRWIAIGLIALLVGVNVSAAQENPPPPKPGEDIAAVNPALAEQLTALESVTEKLRDLPAEAQVERQFPTRQETIEYLRDLYARELPPEEFDRLEKFYVALGLLPADIDLQKVYLDLLNSQVAGFYDPDTKTMNVIPSVGDDVGDNLSITEQIIYVHEFTHALQDQHFDLNALQDAAADASPDASLALTALIEGDATAAMTLYLQEVAARNPLAVFGILLEGAQAGTLVLPPGIPQILTDELLFPYEGGMNFVLSLSDEGGWDAVDAAFANPPITSEQILHPDKYKAGEVGQEVVLPDMSAALGSGWTQAWDTTIGEFYLEKHLATQLPGTEAEQAAAGWGGDNFQVYSNGDQLAWALRLAWDSAEDGAEFNDAYAQYGENRFGGEAGEDGCWEDASGALCVVAMPSDTESYIVSAPTIEQALALAGV